MIPYGRQDVSRADIDAVISILESDFLTTGRNVPRFENVIAAYCDASEAMAVNSATSTFHITCLALDLSEGDWLWISPRTFVASANCALYCGAKVYFVNVDPLTDNLCSRKLEQKLVQAEKSGVLPKIVIPVHYPGQPCDMPKIYALALEYGFKIIKDASYALGNVGIERVQQRLDRTNVFAHYTMMSADWDSLAAALKEQGMPTAVHYPIPLNEQTAYQAFCCSGCTPVAQRIARQVMTLPMGPALDPGFQSATSSALRDS